MAAATRYTGVESTVETSTTAPRTASEIMAAMEAEDAAEKGKEESSIFDEMKETYAKVKGVTNKVAGAVNKVTNIAGNFVKDDAKSSGLGKVAKGLGLAGGVAVATKIIDVVKDHIDNNDSPDTKPTPETDATETISAKSTYVPGAAVLKQMAENKQAIEAAGGKYKQLGFTDDQVNLMDPRDITRAYGAKLIQNPVSKTVIDNFTKMTESQLGPVFEFSMKALSNVKAKVLPELAVADTEFLGETFSVGAEPFKQEEAVADVQALYNNNDAVTVDHDEPAPTEPTAEDITAKRVKQMELALGDIPVGPNPNALELGGPEYI
ncbi:hypothetical protein J6A31_07505 [bacterium]|nr:hypothetical protein [bacterium]